MKTKSINFTSPTKTTFLPATKKEMWMKTATIVAFALVIASSLVILHSTAFAAPNAQAAFKEVFKIVGRLAFALGAVMGLMGVIHYASANSEGDGPAKQKAMMQIASSIMLFLVGFAVQSDAVLGVFAGFVE